MPSFREMAKALNVSAVGTIQGLVRGLLERGYLEKEGRRLALPSKRKAENFSVPIVGEVAAGSLTDAFEVSLGTLSLTPELLGLKNDGEWPRDRFFALRVKGESMIEAGILPKDMVVVDRSSRVRSGDIVVALYRDEATVKEIQFPRKSSDLVRLLPHNSKLEPIEVPGDQKLKVLGKVVALQRVMA